MSCPYDYYTDICWKCKVSLTSEELTKPEHVNYIKWKDCLTSEEINKTEHVNCIKWKVVSYKWGNK